MSQGDIVSNKRLGAVLSQIQAEQRRRDKELLASSKVTRRRKEQIRTGRTLADAPIANR